MTTNMQIIVDNTTAIVNRKFGNTLPTLDQINDEAAVVRTAFSAFYPITDEEFAQVKKTLAAEILHSIGYAVTLHGRDAQHQSWYFVQENDGFYWNRYRTYLKSIKHWGIEVVNRLHKTTDDIMDDLGNPKDHSRPFQRRGLLLGDVQSGKTATYTAICNKASDAGYRVIIVLAGMMENLRVQTQERLDAEFVGIESKYTLDKKAGQELRKTPVGVGKIPPINQDKRIACFTSVATDFNKATIMAFGLSLRTLNGTALFVVKKNKSVLNNLYKWLMENNAGYQDGLIDLPLLLIDDEADNASVNTNTEEKDPTAINLQLIWSRQQVPDLITNELVKITKYVFERITDPHRGTINVTQWCKREACWESMKACPIKLSDEMVKVLLGKEEAKTAEKEAKKDQKLISDVQAQAKVLELGADFWKKVNAFVIQKRVSMSPDQLKALKYAVRIPAQLPSAYQSLQLLDLLERAEANGFKA